MRSPCRRISSAGRHNQPFVYLATSAISLAGRDVEIGESLNGKTRILRAFPRERELWATAACFFSLLIRCSTEDAASMIHHIVQFALRQRLLILLVVGFIAVGGAISFQHMPVDAYPDLSPPMVEVITQWPGHAAEESNDWSTIPTEVEMNGVPKMAVMLRFLCMGFPM